MDNATLSEESSHKKRKQYHLKLNKREEDLFQKCRLKFNTNAEMIRVFINSFSFFGDEKNMIPASFLLDRRFQFRRYDHTFWLDESDYKKIGPAIKKYGLTFHDLIVLAMHSYHHGLILLNHRESEEEE